ncbi:CBO2463/CBO2479 domain-containing protein [Spiroplasma alleghenense]|uniref:Uncharacterized protein n=1 Tax=Spiroplasma alleghenense TaxID=216931 RepID=A0A345Z2P7_9MOLU|nr:CBO2463/CBO2479 domain-containing protein [Spiroplasma alleghenense]AXK50876.1 hypothetical protein SALLE_v1c02000 [Spiroplasma alleghenense]
MLIDSDQARLYQGVITKFDDVSVSIDLLGRMGEMRFPLRMIITDYPLKVGQLVSISLSYPQVISDEIYQK